jgi:hypothetical protein
MVPWRASEEGLVTPDLLDWYECFARGRPGAIVVEATGIRDVPSGPLLRISHDRFLPRLRDLVRVVEPPRRQQRLSTSAFCDQTFQLAALSPFLATHRYVICINNSRSPMARFFTGKFYCAEHVSISSPKVSIVSNSCANPRSIYLFSQDSICKPMNLGCFL